MTHRTLSRRTMLGYLGATGLGLLASGRTLANVFHSPLNPLVGGARPTGEAERLHLVLTGYTLDPRHCGDKCAADLDAMRRTFTNAGLGDRLQVHDLVSNYSARGVMDYLHGSRKMQEVSPRDVVFYFHAGHGGGLEPGTGEESHRLQVNDTEPLNRLEIRQALQAKNPYGLILLTNCCSGGQLVHVPSPLRELQVGSPNQQTIRNLFLRRPQLINITAAQPGTPASASHSPSINGRGAQCAFTVALLELLYDFTVFESWQQFFPRLSTGTLQASANVYNGPPPHRPYQFGPLLEHGSAPAIGHRAA